MAKKTRPRLAPTYGCARNLEISQMIVNDGRKILWGTKWLPTCVCYFDLHSGKKSPGPCRRPPNSGKKSYDLPVWNNFGIFFCCTNGDKHIWCVKHDDQHCTLIAWSKQPLAQIDVTFHNVHDEPELPEHEVQVPEDAHLEGQALSHVFKTRSVQDTFHDAFFCLTHHVNFSGDRVRGTGFCCPLHRAPSGDRVRGARTCRHPCSAFSSDRKRGSNTCRCPHMSNQLQWSRTWRSHLLSSMPHQRQWLSVVLCRTTVKSMGTVTSGRGEKIDRFFSCLTFLFFCSKLPRPSNNFEFSKSPWPTLKAFFITPVIFCLCELPAFTLQELKWCNHFCPPWYQDFPGSSCVLGKHLHDLRNWLAHDDVHCDADSSLFLEEESSARGQPLRQNSWKHYLESSAHKKTSLHSKALGRGHTGNRVAGEKHQSAIAKTIKVKYHISQDRQGEAAFRAHWPLHTVRTTWASSESARLGTRRAGRQSTKASVLQWSRVVECHAASCGLFVSGSGFWQVFATIAEHSNLWYLENNSETRAIFAFRKQGQKASFSIKSNRGGKKSRVFLHGGADGQTHGLRDQLFLLCWKLSNPPAHYDRGNWDGGRTHFVWQRSHTWKIFPN